MNLIQFKKEISYGPGWENFLPQGFFLEQLSSYTQESSRGITPRKEHYKWAAYRHILEQYDLSLADNWAKFVNLVDSDSDAHLFKGILSELIDKGKINAAYFTSLTSEKILGCSKVKAILKRGIIGS